MRWLWVIGLAMACSPPTTIQSSALLADRDRHDVVAIRNHAWELWARLSGGEWDSWTPTEQLFQHAAKQEPRFRPPRPFRHGEDIMSEELPVVFDVLFDPHGAEHVKKQQLEKRAVLDKLHVFPDFPTDAVVVKLTWFAVKAHGLTTMPIWDGEPAVENGNPDTTWHRTITVDPSDLSKFISRDITAATVESARLSTHDKTLAVGDHVVLVAAHVTTKEIPDWTWETYWWHDTPDVGRYATNRPGTIHGAAANYLMDATYSADQPCFNPWLEARFPDGLASNCVTCHQRAVVGAADYLPVTHGRLRGDDPYFDGHLATDFMWSVAFESR